jgi:hypothetical protein
MEYIIQWKQVFFKKIIQREKQGWNLRVFLGRCPWLETLEGSRVPKERGRNSLGRDYG